MSMNFGLETERYTLGRLAPAGYYVGLHIRFASPVLILENYPKDWMERYTEQAYALRDPVVAWGYSTIGAARWSEIEIPDPFDIFGQSAAHGLTYGVSVAVGSLKSRTIGSLTRSDREYTDEEIASVLQLIEKLHATTEPPDSLTQAQAEALRLIAAGNRHGVAAQKLQISPSALKARLIGARNKLHARTTAEAIQRAKDYRLL